MERFVALFKGDAEAAVIAVNTEVQNPTACALMDVAYMRGPNALRKAGPDLIHGAVDCDPHSAGVGCTRAAMATGRRG
jgi:hypothetical protein